jgi:hypothetical protein
MISEKFIIFGAFLSFIGGLSYLVDTLKGKAKPNRVSWFVWALAPMIAFFASLEQGVGLYSLMTFMAGFNPLLIFIASFVNKQASWKVTKFDLFCGFVAIIGVVLWRITGDGNLAILLSIVADGVAAIPTVIKSYKYPETENYMGFLLSGIAALITLLAINTWTFEYYAFPLYIYSWFVHYYLLLLGSRLDPRLINQRAYI